MLIFLQVLLLELFRFFLVSLSFFVVIILESVVDLGEDVGLEAVQVLLRDHALRLSRVQGLGHRQSVQVCLSSDQVRSCEGLLEVGDLLLQDAVLAL